MRKIVLALLSTACLLAGCTVAPAPLEGAPQGMTLAAQGTPEPPALWKAELEGTAGSGMAAPPKTCDTSSDVQQCCADARCSGKILNNRDAHNCKNSGGKSWHAASRGGAPAACSRL